MSNTRDKKTDKRFAAILVITLLFSALLLWRYFSVMVLKSSPGGDPGRTPPVERGPIMDRNGRILAIQNELDSVEAWIPYIGNKSQTAEELASILDLDSSSLRNSFETRNGSMWIKRKITPTESEKVGEYLRTSGSSGIYLRKEFGRNYPQQNLASHILGYTGTDNHGLDGIEYTMDDILSPKEHLSQPDQRYGNQLFLTIDVNIQYFAEELSRQAFGEHNPDWITMIVMDAKNGDLLACVGLPDFDPNNFQSYTQEERRSWPVVTAYEPGSVFKIFSLAAFLDLGVLSIHDTFVCGGSYESENFSGAITCLRPHGRVTPADIIKYSCNVGTAYASELASRSELYEYLTAFGFGSSTQLPLPGESNGLLRSPSSWSARSKPTIAFGQEVLVSAVQMAAAATVFANDGVLLKPHVVDKIVSPSGSVIADYTREPVRRVLNPQTARNTLAMMETAVASGGTAWRMATPGIRISAKTGTAQLIDPRTGRYSDEVFGASALAILPSDDPRYIIYMNIENPRGRSIYGSTIAVPVIKELIEELLIYAEIPNRNEQTVVHPGYVRIPVQERPDMGGIIPDLYGYSKRELLPLLQEENFSLDIRGEGWVVRQEPAPGTPITPGMILRLELE